MKTMILILLIASSACVVQPRESTSDQDAVCDPNCDPANVQYVLSAYIGEAQRIGSQMGPPYCRVVHGYNDYGDYESWNECSGPTADHSGGRWLTDCADRSGAPICSSLLCGVDISCP